MSFVPIAKLQDAEMLYKRLIRLRFLLAPKTVVGEEIFRVQGQALD